MTSSIQEKLNSQFAANTIPNHIGIIMDGNGRWAKERYFPRIEGHRKGAQRAFEIVEAVGQMGVKTLTLYAFSEENWGRPVDEVSALMSLLRWYLEKKRQQIIKQNVQFKVIGNRKRLDKDIVEMVENIEQATINNTGLILNIALSYGARQEICFAMKKILIDSQSKGLDPEQITEDTFASYLETHDVDLLIRTGGVYRVSNFLLWQLAYAELYFEPSYWPDFTKELLFKIIKEYTFRERRFGLISEQLFKPT